MQSGAHLQRASESHHGLLVFATQRVIVADHAARLGAIAIDANAPAGLAFSYPIDGQTDVYPGTTIVFAFSGEAEGDVALIDTESGQALPAAVVAQGNGIYNIRPADSDARMAPATTYAVVARGRIGDDDNTAFEDGESLFAFTTAPANSLMDFSSPPS